MPPTETDAQPPASTDFAVALFVFNRPEKTKRVFETIRAARPGRLLVVADGPRSESERPRCLETRRATEQVDWPCEEEREYAETNLGCRKRLSSGLDWVFSRCEAAIILEDDCLPSAHFFTFASSMLERYRDRDEVMMITGSNALRSWKPRRSDYFFSNYGSIWGWATWSRAWRHYDVQARQWEDPAARQKVRQQLGDERQFRERCRIMEQVRAGKIDTWDYQWTFARLLRSGLCLVPARNLVANIGFDAEATHPQARRSYAETPIYPLTPPYRGPAKPQPDRDYDRRLFSLFTSRHPSFKTVRLEIERLRNLFKRLTSSSQDLTL